MVFHEAHSAYERGLACGERILAQDDIREKTHRDVMRLYWLLALITRNSFLSVL